MTVGAVVVTYRRPDILMGTLDGVLGQDHPPEWVVVVDNDADPSLRDRLVGREGVAYLPLPDNAGYGAALAAGMRDLSAHDPDWYWLLDDDTPPRRTDLSAALAVAADVTPAPWVVSSRGGRMVRGRIRHGFGPGDDLTRAGFALVDGSIVSRAAVQAVGYPREDLFMMMEDIDYSTRITDAGGRLVVRPAEVDAMYMGSDPPWRSYYQARNHLRIALERRSPAFVWGWLSRTAGFVLADVRLRRWTRLRYRALGAFDAVRGRMGRVELPGS